MALRASNKCLFCQLPEERVILQFNNFILSLCLGPIVVGHVIIIAREHINSFCESSSLEEFLEVKKNIKRLYAEYFGSCFLFEHGNHANNEEEIHHHAHLHIIPAKANRDIEGLINQYDRIQYSGGYNAEISARLSNQEYLFFEGISEGSEIQPRLFVFPQWPHKYFVRRIILDAMNKDLEELDWKIHPNTEIMIQTKQLLESILIKGAKYAKV